MKKIMVLPVAAAVAAALSLPAQADITVYKKGDQKLAFGGRVQLQYRDVDVDGGDSTSDIGFRRLRTFLKGNIDKNTSFKIQGDFGAGSGLNGDSDFDLVDGYVNHKLSNGVQIRWGNAHVPFSREELTSSKKTQIIERTLVGGSNSGSPSRQVGVYFKAPRVKGETKFIWDAGLSIASVDQDNSQIDINSIVSNAGSGDDPEGYLVSGRLQYFPQGFFKPAQGDFKGGSGKFGFAVAAYNWSNDGDVDTTDDAVEDITGFEISGAFRGAGFSVDAQYNLIDATLENPGLQARTVGDGNVYDAGGDAELDVFAIEGGYMIVPAKFEIALAYSSQDSDNYADEFTQTSFGLNYFVKKHNLKYQLSYTQEENVNGEAGDDQDVLRLQAQLVF